MKSSKLILIAAISLLISVFSCKDECDDVVCQNGGICEEDICNCLDGYSGENCEIFNPCFGIICNNNGECINGQCECPSGFYGDSCENKTVQSRLDSGEETPFDLLNDNVPLDSLYGKFYQEGLIFHLNSTTGIGLIAASTDQSTGVEWGCFGTNIIGLENVEDCSGNCLQPIPQETEEGARVGDGMDNTNAIISGCTSNGIAAKLCRNFGEDWFLPSRGELNLMYLHLHEKGYGDFTEDFYWSSTEGGDYVAWNQSFDHGFIDQLNKVNSGIAVRAVRIFE